MRKLAFSLFPQLESCQTVWMISSEDALSLLAHHEEMRKQSATQNCSPQSSMFSASPEEHNVPKMVYFRK